MRARLPDAIKLFHDSVEVFARMEHVGLKVDTKYLDKTINKVKKRINRLQDKLKNDEICKEWQKRYGLKTNFGSRAQLTEVLFNTMKFKPTKENEENFKLKGRYKGDANQLEYLNIPFVKDYLRIEQLKKLKSTYLVGLKRETVDDFCHPFFNLHKNWSFRSSSDRINFQNIIARDEELSKLIRSAFIPLGPDWVIVETDFKAIEVSISACYHKDPRFIHDITVPRADMHRDTSVLAFKLKKDQISDATRSHIKNKVVFPFFYGDWFLACAKSVWTAIERFDLTTVGDGTPKEPNGISLFDHLKSKGITSLGNEDPKNVVKGTFEHHLKKVEEEFWRKFKVYAQWKNSFWEQYCERGYFDLKTGFRCSGVFDKKQVCNVPIQGAAFHCLLWVLIQMDKWLRKNKMKSKLCGQIHDSGLAHVYKPEKDDYIGKITELISVDLPKAWPWIIVPMKGEVEVAETNWFEKKKVA